MPHRYIPSKRLAFVRKLLPKDFTDEQVATEIMRLVRLAEIAQSIAERRQRERNRKR